MEIAIAEETDYTAAAQRRQQHSPRVVVERFDTNTDRLTLLFEPGEELGRIEFLGDGGHRETD